MNDVSAPLPPATARAAARKLSLALLRGVEALQNQEYLPKWPGERNVTGGIGGSDDGYSARLKEARLDPDYADAIDDLAARPFSRPLSLGEDVPASTSSKTKIRTAGEGGEWLGHEEDIDNRGNSLHVFLWKHFAMALGEGAGAIMVDHTPRRVPGKTQADDKADGGRPYWISIRDSELLDGPAVWTTDASGKRVAARVRRGPVKVWVNDDLGTFPGGHEEELIYAYYRGDPNAPDVDGAPSPERFAYYRVWRLNEKLNEWIETTPEDNRIRPHTEIPIAFLEFNDEGKPPLSGLANLSLADFRKKSNSDIFIFRSALMMLTATGVDDNEVANNIRAIGHAFLFHSSRPEAKFGSIEPTGGAWQAIREDQQDLKRQIREAALRPLVIGRTGGVTATEIAVAESRARSQLEAWVIALEDQANEALRFHALYLGEEDGGSLKATREFGVTAMLASETGKLILDMMGPGPHLTRETGLAELQLRGIVSERVNPEEEARKVEDAKPPGLSLEDDERVSAMEQRLAKVEGMGGDREEPGGGGERGDDNMPM